jgi:hypothetical protein
MQQIADWLKKLGMSDYTDRFVENKIDISVLPDLTEQHLKDLGIALGDRLKMRRAIRDLGSVTTPAATLKTEPSPRDDAERRQREVCQINKLPRIVMRAATHICRHCKRRYRPEGRAKFSKYCTRECLTAALQERVKRRKQATAKPKQARPWGKGPARQALRARIIDTIKTHPDSSNSQIATLANCSKSAVQRARKAAQRPQRVLPPRRDAYQRS